MRAVTEIAEPGFEGWRVIFLDGGAVDDDAGCAGDRGPFAGCVEEGNVDVLVALDVVGFA